MSMNSGWSKLGLWDSGSDKVGIESIIDKLSRNFVRSNKIVNAWTSDKKGATEAILTPWGTIELRDKNKKVIWSTSGTPGKGPVSTCTVDYSNLDTNSGSIQESSISTTMGGNCNGKLKPGSSSKYSVKTGNFNENVKGWLETSQESKEDKFTVNWTDKVLEIVVMIAIFLNITINIMQIQVKIRIHNAQNSGMIDTAEVILQI